MSLDAIEHLALIIGRGVLALGPDIVAIAAAPDGASRIAKLVRAGLHADQVALREAREAIDTKVERLPHREGGNPPGEPGKP